MRIWVQSSGCLFIWYGKYYCKMLRNKWIKWLSKFQNGLILLLKTMPNLLYRCSLIFKLHHRQPYSNTINFDKTGWTGIPVPWTGKENKIHTHGPWYCSIVAPLSKTTSTKHSWFAVIFGIAKIQSNHQTLQKSNKSIVWSISSKCIHICKALRRFLTKLPCDPPFWILPSGAVAFKHVPECQARSVTPPRNGVPFRAPQKGHLFYREISRKLRSESKHFLICLQVGKEGCSKFYLRLKLNMFKVIRDAQVFVNSRL